MRTQKFYKQVDRLYKKKVEKTSGERMYWFGFGAGVSAATFVISMAYSIWSMR